MMIPSRFRTLLLAALVGGAGIVVDAHAQTSLKTAFESSFLIGAALNQNQFSGKDLEGVALIKQHFNTITPENVLKWQHVHPRPNEYAFEAQDQFVAFGEENDMFIVGHTLVWHSQTPRWVFQDESGNPLT
ncbi:MAG TPA: endo-1,4-beta-xylanase, partial [Rhodothermales bacterium]